MRVFFALTFSDKTKKDITMYRDIIANQVSKGRFTREDNFHLTLEFIGEVNHKELETLIEILYRMDEEPLALRGTFIGSFKKKNRDIVWMGLDKSNALIAMQKRLVQFMKAEGLNPEKRKYKPHITLGRQVLMDLNLSDMVIQPIELEIVSLALMESKNVGGILKYEAIEAVIL